VKHHALQRNVKAVFQTQSYACSRDTSRDTKTRQQFCGCEVWLDAKPSASAGHNGGYIGSPELGLLNVLQAREQVPNAPLCSDPVALDRLWNETVKCIDDASGEHWAKDGPQAPPATHDTPVAGVSK